MRRSLLLQRHRRPTIFALLAMSAVVLLSAGDASTSESTSIASIRPVAEATAQQQASLDARLHSAGATRTVYGYSSSIYGALERSAAATVIVTETGGTAVTEGGATDTYTIKLKTNPASNVVITLAHSGGQVTYSPSSLTFTSTTGRAARTVTVTAVNDFVDEASPLTGTITHAATSSDPNYNGKAVSNVVASITDNDTAGVTVTQAGGTNVTEGGATDTYTVQLNSQPTGNVTVTPSSSGGQATVSPSSLNFTSANWSATQTVTVTAVNDDIDEDSPHTGAITHSAASTDPFYSGISIGSVTAFVTDNDVAGVTVTESSGSTAISENGVTDTYTIRLNSEPTANVTITPGNTSGRLSLTPSGVTFTAANWDTPRIITVNAVDDDIDEDSPPANVTHDATSSDPKYSGITVEDVAATITDDDTAGVTITLTGPSTIVNEFGATDSYSVRLTSEPTADVTIAVTDPGSQVSLSPSSLTFTAADWDTPQDVTITATNDVIDERPAPPAPDPHQTTLTSTSTSSDPKYSGISIDGVDIEIRDNDYSGITITETDSYTLVTEAATGDSYTVRLNTQPAGAASVTIVLSTPDSEITVSPSTLTIAAADWAEPQTIDVVAVDDDIAENSPKNSTIPGTTTSADPNYDLLTLETLAIQVADDDVAGITLTHSAGTTSVTEGGATDGLTVELSSEPTADVTVALSNSTSQLTPSPASLTFTSENWDSPRSVTVTAVNDQVDEVSPHPGVIASAATSSDPFYQGMTGNQISAGITDNDTAATLVTLTGSDTLVGEGATTDTYSVKLLTKPTANVVITPSVAGGEATISPASRTFTAANWNTAQSFTVTAADDTDDESATHTDVIHHAATSVDGFYQGVAVADVSLSIVDDDDYTAPVTASVKAPLFAKGTSKVKPFKVSWSATDTESAVASYDLRYRSARYDKKLLSYSTWKSATTAKTAKFKGKQGRTYCFSMRARDSAGNLSSWGSERCSAVPANNTIFTHKGKWQKKKAKGHYLSTYSITKTKGDSLSKVVRAKRIVLIATTCPTCGRVKIYMGKTLLKTVNLKSATLKMNRSIKVKTFSKLKKATLKIVVTTSGKEVRIEGVGLNRG